jgi:hypothetical protein
LALFNEGTIGFHAEQAARAADSVYMITTSDLIGTWQFARPEEGPEPAFLHFSYAQAFDFICDGEVRQPLRLWYSLEGPDVIRFRTRPEDEGWVCRLEYDGETLVINAENGRTVCTRANPDEIPDWFHEGLARCIASA